MNAITCTGQQIHDLYEALPDSPTSSVHCVVIYSLNMQGKVAMVCFHKIENAETLACYEISDSLTEAQFLALINAQLIQPMQPTKVEGIDSILGVITCTKAQYAAIVGLCDDMGHLYSLKQTDKIDRAASTDILDGGRVTLKCVVTDIPTEASWLATVNSAAIKVDHLTFDTP